MTLGDALGHVDVASRVFMSRTDARDVWAVTHAVADHQHVALCGAPTAGPSDVLWPEPGQGWPAGPSRCPSCTMVMSAPRA